jgi:ankyrin repeat protein
MDDWKKQVDDLLYQGKNQIAEEVFNQRLKATLLLSFQEYQKKIAPTQDISNIQSAHKENHPNKQDFKNPQYEEKPSAQATQVFKRKTQSLRPDNEQKNREAKSNLQAASDNKKKAQSLLPVKNQNTRELTSKKLNPQATSNLNKKTQSISSVNNQNTKEQLIQKSTYLLNKFTESFLEIFLHCEDLLQYRKLKLPEFSNQTFLDTIICDEKKKLIFEQLLIKKPLLIRKFFNSLELANMDNLALLEVNLSEIMRTQYMKILISIFEQFNFPGFIVNHMVNPNGINLLAQVIDGGSIGGLNTLLKIKGVDVNKRDKFGSTPLLLAVNINNIKAVNMLLKCEGIDVNLADDEGLTPIIAATDDTTIDSLKALLKCKGLQHDEHLTPLCIAVKFNQQEAVKVLLHVKGVGVPYLDKLLIFAKEKGANKEIIELIKARRKQINVIEYEPTEQSNSYSSYHFFKYNTNGRDELEYIYSHTFNSSNK